MVEEEGDCWEGVGFAGLEGGRDERRLMIEDR
jgi:hypothetical protein